MLLNVSTENILKRIISVSDALVTFVRNNYEYFYVIEREMEKQV
jgi:hypothetical protein